MQPDQDRADERAEELADEVDRDVCPRRLAGNGQPKRHGRIQVRTTDRRRHKRADKDCHGPGRRNDNPARVVALRLAEQDVGDHAIAQQDQQHCADGLA